MPSEGKTERDDVNDDELTAETLAYLEDLLFESVSFADDEEDWNAASKTGC